MADKKISQLTPATTPLAGTEVLPIVQGTTTVKVANNDLRPKQIQSNATSGVLQVTGPAAASTRVMTTPDADFSVARTDAAQNFAGNNTFDTTTLCVDATNNRVGVGTATPALTFDVPSNTIGCQLIYFSKSGSYSTYLGKGAGDEGLVFYIPDNTYFDLYTNGTKAIRVDSSQNVSVTAGNLVIGTSGKGIDFSATANSGGTMTSELLADYEEGTWTPVLTYTTPGTLSVSYSLQTGTYTKIGRNVFYTLDLRLSAFTKGTASGTLIITGLPYSNLFGEYGASLWTYNVPLPTTSGVYPVAVLTSSRIQLQTIQNDSGYGSFPDPDSDSQFKINGTYTV